MPTSDAQPSRQFPRRPQIISLTHSIPSSQPQGGPDATPSPLPFASPISPHPSLPTRPVTPVPATEPSEMSYENAIDFATHSWDLATGGLKTLTAKREFPTRLDRRLTELPPDFNESATRSYTLAMIVLLCVIFMLIGGGVILFVMLQQ